MSSVFRTAMGPGRREIHVSDHEGLKDAQGLDIQEAVAREFPTAASGLLGGISVHVRDDVPEGVLRFVDGAGREQDFDIESGAPLCDVEGCKNPATVKLEWGVGGAYLCERHYHGYGDDETRDDGEGE